MRSKLALIIIYLFIFLCSPLFAQTHTSVSLDSHVYYILEQAEVKGLCAPLPGARPYTQNVIFKAINEILNSENAKKLNNSEREILVQYLDKFSKPKTGLDWQRGGYYNETAVGRNDTPLSANLGTRVDVEGSTGLYTSFDKPYFGTEIWVKLFLNGDLGRNVSYDFSAEGGLMAAPREYLGLYNTYYEGFQDHDDFQNQIIQVYSEPLTHFPYTYKKRWDGSVYFFDDLTMFESWPNSPAGGYNLLSELTGSFFEDKLILRLGRLSHDWGLAPLGSSLAFNQMARPFLGIEAGFNPFSWFGFSSLTGILEYFNLKGIYDSPLTNQNAFSVTMLQFRYKNYLFFDFVDAVIWPKRFELGYMVPIINSFFYQNNIGKFDNMAVTLNLKAQYPGLGNLWLSLFVDEMQLVSNWYELDRTMIAVQAGLNFPLPILSFSSVGISYTAVNPYNYTHHRNYLPWYGDLLMEKLYANNGVSLGYYLPPNSDEFLVRFKTIPANNIAAYTQYQLIRHGADFGPQAVDGSNLYSELDPDGRDGSNPVLKRFFLQDGAYQWMHIIRLGAEWTIPRLPLALFGEAGTMYSYFTDIEAGKANTGTPYPYSIVDTPDYRKSTGFVFKLGFRLFP